MKMELSKKYTPTQHCNPFKEGRHTTCRKNLQNIHPWMTKMPSLKSKCGYLTSVGKVLPSTV
jgi:hypothetical protein